MRDSVLEGDRSNKAQGGLATVRYALADVLLTDSGLRGISGALFCVNNFHESPYN